ncbi:MAG: sugar transferase [Terracidiphilus sp.]
MLKRSVDVALAGALLAAALPVLIVAVILIKIDSRGPALFRQKRMGRGFRPFEILKLRTMRQGCGGLNFTLAADARVTRAGLWLRRLKVDELPQLWNVLRGEMSLVGPRPVVEELAEEFAVEYRRLLAARPGLTDPATLKYRNESERLARTPDPHRIFKTVITPDKVRISLDYQQRATFWSDLAILLRTAITLLAPASANLPAQPVYRGVSPIFFRPQPVRRRSLPAFAGAQLTGPAEFFAPGEVRATAAAAVHGYRRTAATGAEAARFRDGIWP